MCEVIKGIRVQQLVPDIRNDAPSAFGLWLLGETLAKALPPFKVLGIREPGQKTKG